MENAPAPRAVVAPSRVLFLSAVRLGKGDGTELGEVLTPSVLMAGGDEEITRVGLDSAVGALRMESIEKDAGFVQEFGEDVPLRSTGCFKGGSGDTGGIGITGG